MEAKMPSPPDGLVWLASFPKAGNTWLRVLLTNVLADHEQPTDINTVRLAGIASSRPIFEDDTLVDSNLLTEPEAERFRPAFHDFRSREKGVQFSKVHDAFSHLADGTPMLGTGARAALYVVRDPRDVAVSYSHHFSLSLEEAVSKLADRELVLSSSPRQMRQTLLDWSGHVRSWLDQRCVPVHLMRYEDMLSDTAATLRRALDFLGISSSTESVARAVRHSAFAELRRQEQAHGFRERVSADRPFFREGRAGAWRERLSPELARRIERDHGEVMVRLGYDDEAMGTAA
jgi:aryl sulfotransferase